MSNPGEPIDALFASITDGVELAFPTALLPAERRGAQSVLVDEWIGATFREQVCGTVLNELGRLGLPKLLRQELNNGNADRVIEAMYAKLLAPTLKIRAGGEIAVIGAGLLQGYGGEDADESEEIEGVEGADILVLDGSQVLYGTLTGGGYGEFPIGDGTKDPDELVDEEGIYLGPTDHGPLIRLGDVALYARGEESDADRYDAVYVPIGESNFHLYGVHDL